MRRPSNAIALLITAASAVLIGLTPPLFAAPPRPTAPSGGGPTTRPLSAPTPQAMRRTTPKLNLDNVPFIDALNFVVRDSLGINLYVNWPAIEAAGVDKNTPISLKLNGAIRAAKILDLILESAGGGVARLAWYVEDGVLHVTTVEQADTVMMTQVFPVQDLVVDVPDFPGQPFDFGQADSNSGGDPSGGGGSSSSLFGNGGGRNSDDEAQQDRLSKQERGDQLAELVRSTLEAKMGASSATGGVASPLRVVYFNGNLIVTAPRRLLMGR